MAVNESNPDPKVRKNVHNFLMTVAVCATSELSMRVWNWNITDFKKTIFDLIIQRYIQIWQSKEMSHDFVRGQSVAETCSWHWGYHCTSNRLVSKKNKQTEEIHINPEKNTKKHQNDFFSGNSLYYRSLTFHKIIFYPLILFHAINYTKCFNLIKVYPFFFNINHFMWHLRLFLMNY